MLAFRSLLVPLKAAVMNLLSVAAAYGVVTFVFQEGHGATLIGLDGPIPIVSFVPLLMFAILFGLSMDYEVFLLTQIQEHYKESGDAHEAVVEGLATTGRVITSAALIMVCVFTSFVLNGDPMVKEFGVGLAVAIAIDATLVRCLLVPAVMVAAGQAGLVDAALARPGPAPHQHRGLRVLRGDRREGGGGEARAGAGTQRLTAQGSRPSHRSCHWRARRRSRPSPRCRYRRPTHPDRGCRPRARHPPSRGSGEIACSSFCEITARLQTILRIILATSRAGGLGPGSRSPIAVLGPNFPSRGSPAAFALAWVLRRRTSGRPRRARARQHPAARWCCCSPPHPPPAPARTSASPASPRSPRPSVHVRAGRINWRLFAWMAPPSMAGAVAGGYLSGLLPGDVLLAIIGALLLYFGVDLLRPADRRGPLRPTGRGASSTSAPPSSAGAVIGVLGGLVGLILGALRMPALLRYVGEAPARGGRHEPGRRRLRGCRRRDRPHARGGRLGSARDRSSSVGAGRPAGRAPYREVERAHSCCWRSAPCSS